MVSRLQTVMILLEHFENQYCSTTQPPLGPGPPPLPALPPCLPAPPKQTLGGLAVLRLQDRLGTWLRPRLTEMQVSWWRSPSQCVAVSRSCPWHRSQTVRVSQSVPSSHHWRHLRRQLCGPPSSLWLPSSDWQCEGPETTDCITLHTSHNHTNHGQIFRILRNFTKFIKVSW